MTQEIPSLESKCQECLGSGRRKHRDGFDFQCRRCGGTGAIPTEFGKQVLAFISDHLPPEVFSGR